MIIHETLWENKLYVETASIIMLFLFITGSVLFYMKFRDLLANVTAHFFADFVLNVVLPLVSGA